MEKTTLADKYLTFSEESRKLLKSGAVELLIYTFNNVYPEICDFFNNGEILNVVFEADPNCGSPALITVWNTYTMEILENNRIKFNPNDKIFQRQPMDIDFITHELVHVAQNYRYGYKPSWIVEGLADYGREKFGLNNKKGGWWLPKYREYQNYTDGYSVTAAFFIWLEENIAKNFVKDLNNTLKAGKYTDDYFAEKTGRPVDELWKMYADANKAAQRKNMQSHIIENVNVKVEIGKVYKSDNEIVVELGRSITPVELTEIVAGSGIELDKKVRVNSETNIVEYIEPFDVLVSGRIVAKGNIETNDGVYFIKIIEVVDKKNNIADLEEGNIIELYKNAQNVLLDGLLDVFANGKLIAKGDIGINLRKKDEAVILDGNLSVLIKEVIKTN